MDTCYLMKMNGHVLLNEIAHRGFGYFFHCTMNHNNLIGRLLPTHIFYIPHLLLVYVI